MADSVIDPLQDNIITFLGGPTCIIQPHGSPHKLTGISEYGGASRTKDGLVMQVSLPGQDIVTRLCTRDHLPFADIEIQMCNRLIAAVAALYAHIEESTFRAHFRTAVLTSAFDMAVARLLRRGKSSQFSNIQLILQTFRDLCFARYEGEAATSALIYTPNIPKFVEDAATIGVSLSEIGGGSKFCPGFFSDPLTYRIVSGTSGFYLSTVNRKIYGIGRFSNPSEYDYIDRANGHHLANCLALVRSKRPFAIRTTANSEVQILMKDGNQLLWRNNRWHVFIPDHFVRFLEPVGVDEDLARLLASTAFAMSEARHGTVILVAPEGSNKIKQKLIKVSISHSDIASELTRQLAQTTLQTLKKSGLLLGTLSSDGVVHISPEGRIVRIGMIVNTDYAASDVFGGGRTAAASAASQDEFGGRAIKVSQDGSIDLFVHGRSVYRFG